MKLAEQEKIKEERLRRKKLEKQLEIERKLKEKKG